MKLKLANSYFTQWQGWQHSLPCCLSPQLASAPFTPIHSPAWLWLPGPKGREGFPQPSSMPLVTKKKNAAWQRLRGLDMAGKERNINFLLLISTKEQILWHKFWFLWQLGKKKKSHHWRLWGFCSIFLSELWSPKSLALPKVISDFLQT